MKQWENEPNHVEFRYRGFPCLIHRNGGGALCGYVGLTNTHPLHGKDWSQLEESISVHGGITYSKSCQGSICHVPKEGETGNIWWLGFDCAHYLDIVPCIEEMRGELKKDIFRPAVELLKFFQEFESHIFPQIKPTYKTIAFVKNQIRNLVKQLERVEA